MNDNCWIIVHNKIEGKKAVHKSSSLQDFLMTRQLWWPSGPPGLTLLESLNWLPAAAACRAMLAFKTCLETCINVRSLVILFNNGRGGERDSELEIVSNTRKRQKENLRFALAAIVEAMCLKNCSMYRHLRSCEPGRIAHIDSYIYRPPISPSHFNNIASTDKWVKNLYFSACIPLPKKDKIIYKLTFVLFAGIHCTSEILCEVLIVFNYAFNNLTKCGIECGGLVCFK